MDKKKRAALISAICVIIVLILSIIIYMAVSGKFKSAETDAETQARTALTEETDGRPKTSLPASPIAVIFNSDSTDDLNAAMNIGFNTIIFEYSSDNEDNLKSLFSVCRENEICFGCRVSSDEKDNFISFFKNANPDFVIFRGLSDNGEYFVSTIMDIKTKISSTDPYCLLGVEADDVAVMSDYIQAASGAKYFDFLYLSQGSYSINEFESNLTKWESMTSDIWVNFDTGNIYSLSSDDASKITDKIDSLDRTKYTVVSFSDYSALISASSEGADFIKNYIGEEKSSLDNKEFELTNYTDTEITVSEPLINFKGTCSPNYELKCNGIVITTADNGDFSFDCKLNAGQNKVTFEHKDKTYEYHITYNVTVLKSVSPSSEMILPGNMEVELYATAISGADVTASFNGKTYTMSKTTQDNDDESGDDTEFTTYSTTITTPASIATQQNLGAFKVTATYNGVSETKSGADIKVNKKEIVRIPASSTTATTSATTTEPVTTKTTTTKSTTTKAATTKESASETTTEKSTTAKKGMTTTERSTRASTSHTSSYSAARTTTTATTESSSAETSKATTKASTTKVSTTSQSGLQQYSYKSNYGLGTAKYVEITDDYVETYPGNNLKVYSVPDCSPLLKGTVDYYEGSATIDSDVYYILTSGCKVPAVRTDNLASGKTKITQAKVVDGYIMPYNNVKILSITTESNKTIIKLSMNYKVPVNAKLTGQTYSEYSSGRMVKVSSLDCTGLQFTFGSTESISGSLSFSSSVIASATTSRDNDNCILSLKLKSSGKFYGYHTEYDSSGNLVITVSQKPSSVSGYTIMIDPGHGGRDGGSVCSVSSSSWDEAAINLSIALKIRDELQAAGAKVIMTRTDDSFVSLTERNRLVRKYNPDLFISVHCDSSSSSSPYGTTAYYYRAYSQPLAKCIHSRIVKAYSGTIYSGTGRTKVDRGTLFGAYKVARVEECPAVLIEYGFVSEVTECQALQSSTGRTALAKATAEGIKDYIASY